MRIGKREGFRASSLERDAKPCLRRFARRLRNHLRRGVDAMDFARVAHASLGDERKAARPAADVEDDFTWNKASQVGEPLAQGAFAAERQRGGEQVVVLGRGV